MDTIFWIVQGLGVITVLLTIFSFFQKEKWKMMLFLSATNAVLIVTYILCNDLLGGLLVVGALIRTLVYFFYSKNNKRPEPIVMIMFEIYCIVLSIFMWKSPISLFMIINLVVVTYTTWQNDVRTLRFGYVFSSCLLLAYDILLGAYTTAISEVIMLVSVLASLLKYAKVTKSYDNVAQRYFQANQHFWGSKVELNQYFDMISSSVEHSPFYNFGIIKDHKHIEESIMAIKKECQNKKVTEVAYISFDNKNYDEHISDAHMLNMFFPIEFHDVWMKLIDGFNLNDTKCKIQEVEYKKIDESKRDELAELYLKGYLAKSDISKLTKEEKIKVKNFLNLNLTDIQDGYKISAYIAYYKGNPVSMLCTLSNKVECFITKVATVPAFRRKHIASSLMQFSINEHRKEGIQDFVLCTDKYSSNEKFYGFNSFVEFGQAFALNVTDASKYENFLKNNVLE